MIINIGTYYNGQRAFVLRSFEIDKFAVGNGHMVDYRLRHVAIWMWRYEYGFRQVSTRLQFISGYIWTTYSAQDLMLYSTHLSHWAFGPLALRGAGIHLAHEPSPPWRPVRAGEVMYVHHG